MSSLHCNYPDAPGFKVTGPSQEAATDELNHSLLLRERVLRLLKHGPRTADECAEDLGESVLAVRPRLSELRAKGKIVDAGIRRPNRSGKSATVWRLV